MGTIPFHDRLCHFLAFVVSCFVSYEKLETFPVVAEKPSQQHMIPLGQKTENGVRGLSSALTWLRGLSRSGPKATFRLPHMRILILRFLFLDLNTRMASLCATRRLTGMLV